MIAFSLFSRQYPGTEIDLFIDDPLGFDRAYGARREVSLTPELAMPVCGLSDLRALKISGAGKMSDQKDPLAQRQLVEERSWEAAGANGSDLELEQLRRRAAWTLLEKIQWLEEMQKLQVAMGQGRAKPTTR